MGHKLAVSTGKDKLHQGRLTAGLLSAMIIDELTGSPVTGATVKPIIFRSLVTDSRKALTADRTVTRTPLGVSIKEIGNGLYGLIGRPESVLPRLATHTYSIGIQVLAEGYCPAKAIGQITANSEFPVSFTPLNIGIIELRRRPVTIQGSILKRSQGQVKSVGGATVAGDNLAGANLAGARVRVTGIWRQLPSASVVGSPQPEYILSTTSPLSNSYHAPESDICQVELSEVESGPITMFTSADAGSYVITLNRRPAFSSGCLITLSPDDPARDEIHEILSLDAASNNTDFAEVRLKTPLAWTHRAGTQARVVTVSRTGPPNPLSSGAAAGDQTLLCTTLTGIEDRAAVKISSGPSSAASENEYHWVRLYDVVSDSNGFYRLPPVSRIAQMRVDIEMNGEVLSTRVIAPRYPAHDQQVDFILSD